MRKYPPISPYNLEIGRFDIMQRASGPTFNRKRGAWSMSVMVAYCLLLFPFCSQAQKRNTSDSVPSFTRDQCIKYALEHQPALNQSQLNISIAKTTNAINTAGWLPQVNLSANLLHYNQLPTTFITNTAVPGGQPIESHTGMVNTAIPEISATQTIFNPQLFYAAQSAPLYVQQAEQVSDSTKINAVATVSKTFYNLLLTLEQINVLKEDTARLGRNVTDAYHQYVGGIVDETDYEEAVISLNNSKGQLKQQLENINPQYAVLKQVMGFPQEKQFNVVFDTVQMMQDIILDTTKALNYSKRIEYQELQTQRKIQNEVTDYYRLAFLPTLSAFYDYYYEFENSNFSNLFANAYPYSTIGLTFNMPLFTGFSRTNNIKRSKLQEHIVDWQEVNLKSEIYKEYAQTLANYKSNLYNYALMKDNETRAKNVYRIVSLQYKQGIVAYLNMIVAESNLISAEIGYANALFQVLSSKIDVEKAMGDIPYK